MNGQTNNASLMLNTPINTDKIEWTCVSWFNKISNAVTNKTGYFFGNTVANKTGRLFGNTVAALATVFTFIPSLAVDLGYATKRLYDRKVNTAPTQNLMPSNGSERRSNRDYPYLNVPLQDNLSDELYYSVGSQSSTLSVESDRSLKSLV